MKERARLLRKKQTPAEAALWRILKNRKFHGFKFHRQHHFYGYILDFVCLSKKLVIELDGKYHLCQMEYDQVRTDYLESSGFKILRFWNEELFQEEDHVLREIYKNLI